jgi:hypothetical protein
MKMVDQENCCCSVAIEPEAAQESATSKSFALRYLLPGTLLLVAWWIIYRNLASFAAYFTYDLLGLSRESHFSSSLEFFVYDTPKVLMLLTLVVFAVGVVRSFFTPERTRKNPPAMSLRPSLAS